MTHILLVLLLASGGLDLPVAPPQRGDAPPEAPEEEDEEDPRDTPPATFYGEEIDTETDEIVYVIDASGSMVSTGYDAYVTPDGRPSQGTRWDRAAAETIKSIRNLADNFRFNVILYNCSVTQWRSSLVDADPPNKQAAEAWLRGVNWANGGTGTGPATVIGLRQGSEHVVLLTDGEPNCGSNDHARMIQLHNPGATIDVFGIQARGQWRAFCQRVARENGGRYVEVP